jgi:hypothetical protein
MFGVTGELSASSGPSLTGSLRIPSLSPLGGKFVQ